MPVHNTATMPTKIPVKGKPTCTTCPSFLTGRVQQDNLGTTIGSPVCGRKMLPLVAPRQSKDAASRALEHTASNCKWHNEIVRLDPLRATDAPNLSVGMDTNKAEQTLEDVTSRPDCLSCGNYVSAAKVQQEYGWTSPLCRATGSIMLEGRLERYAEKCGSYAARQPHHPIPSNALGSFTLLPAFSDTFGKVNEASAYKQLLDNYVDPKDWPTERPVTAKFAEAGIRAWRKIVDPDGYGEDVYLPIFDGSIFPENERALIPQATDSEAPHLYADHGGIIYTMAVLWMKLDDTPAAWGQGGVGKTELARHLAWLMQIPFHRIVINSASEIDDIGGKMLFKNNQTVPHYGRLARAWKSIGLCLLDEPNTGPADI